MNVLTNTARVVADLAKFHGVTYSRTRSDEFAEVITKLSDDDVGSDETEDLLVAMKTKGVINNGIFVKLLGEHLEEKHV